MKEMNIPVGVSDFEEIRKNGYYYIDKSGLIGELLSRTGTKVTLITRPRRFGKTLGMSMLDSIMDINGEILVISQFTLFASYKKGNRPSWLRAAKHEISVPLYEEFCKKLSDALGKPVGTGEFGADMKVDLLNDGPVTIMMDTHNKE